MAVPSIAGHPQHQTGQRALTTYLARRVSAAPHQISPATCRQQRVRCRVARRPHGLLALCNSQAARTVGFPLKNTQFKSASASTAKISRNAFYAVKCFSLRWLWSFSAFGLLRANTLNLNCRISVCWSRNYRCACGQRLELSRTRVTQVIHHINNMAGIS